MIKQEKSPEILKKPKISEKKPQKPKKFAGLLRS